MKKAIAWLDDNTPFFILPFWITLLVVVAFIIQIYLIVTGQDPRFR